jgi:mannose-1-phosphate guanylyltransferase
MQAMILAAGFGTRLHPYTNFRPKPLFPILTRPLLLLTIDRLKKSGFTSIRVNCHHLGEQIVKVLSLIDGVSVQFEDSILGTGGGLREAIEWMDEGPLLITNGDIYHTIPFKELYDYHVQQNNVITLGVHDYPRFNVLKIHKQRVVGFDGERGIEGSQAFTGIHVINPRVLLDIPAGKKSCILDCYRNYLKNGGSINTFSCDRYFWTDMGTVPDYLKLHKDLVEDNVPCVDELVQLKSRCCYTENDEGPGGCFVHDWAVIDPDAHIGRKSVVSRSVVWDDGRVPEHIKVEDSIISIRE